jgi:hypothetical protein
MIHVNIPLHSAVEIIGSYAAIITAIILVLLQNRRRSMSQNSWVAYGLLVGGGLVERYRNPEAVRCRNRGRYRASGEDDYDYDNDRKPSRNICTEALAAMQTGAALSRGWRFR